MFDRMMNYIHIDEKWFYMTKVNENYYLLPWEETPKRTTKSKRFITKVMFLAAVTRPRFDHVENKVFDGKIGIWPFVYKKPVKRNSKNRERGTLETKAMTSVTKDVIRQMIIEELLPAIKEKMLCSERHRIIIQQDNAKPHCDVDDPILIEAAEDGNFGISFRCQPPNSPDLNVLDLGFLNSIQSLQHKKVPKIIDDLVAAVEESFDELTSDTLNDVFLSLQMAMQATMRCGGGNSYKLGHMKKKALRRKNLLPESLLCDPTVLDRAAVLARVTHTPVRASAPTNAATAPAVNALATPTALTLRVSAPSTNAMIAPPPDGSKLFSLCEVGEKVNCGFCGKPADAAHFCLICSYVVHAICGTSDGEEGYGKPVTCYRCKPSNSL
ncbi:hypothetical protein FisN_13Lu158 [Fistulifera solaris]|uniref:SCAN domain-containing protein n=1 Tax=Fistulifera solaris TaxID=1519565 RepID=A0A1Z5JF95_FISSO|nr:hypothetical protein FisN_13Lu158 [Fistulifera solaris]|eukprot:GAX12673.1 hypothetical protein FisN_13Lu158 [Fistulifera solaris]